MPNTWEINSKTGERVPCDITFKQAMETERFYFIVQENGVPVDGKDRLRLSRFYNQAELEGRIGLHKHRSSRTVVLDILAMQKGIKTMVERLYPGKEEFVTKEVAAVLGPWDLSVDRISRWLHLGFVSPSVKKAAGRGTTNKFNEEDMLFILMFHELLNLGFTREKAFSKLTSGQA